ncbi:phage tail protein [Novispirillum itersonii]|uniref:phage tail protein n=1 Tax=Novispirillum itersonii TaxID=189 RepID=UPI000360D36D|nr:tail fiber protein [Novispirillum itersonii]
MSELYLGQIIFAAFPFAPKGYAFCDGATLPVRQNQALYALIGTRFGGDGSTTFRLPDLRGRVVVGANQWGSSYHLGEYGGVEEVTLTAAQLPAHNHGVMASTVAGSVSAADNIPATTAKNTIAGSIPTPMYAAPSGTNSVVPLSAETVSSVGEGKAHPNMQPFLVVNTAIALTGIFPEFQ